MNLVILLFLAILPVPLGAITRKGIIDTLLNSTEYDPSIPPHVENGGPTMVYVQLYVSRIDTINEISMDYTIDAYFRQTWIDPRLSFSHLSNITRLELDQRRMTDVWVPDTYFPNEKSANLHAVTVPNKLLHISNNGLVTYSVRLSLTLSCIMNLKSYPLDDQTCSILMETYAYSTDNVLLMWEKDDKVILGDIITQDHTLPKFYFYKPLETRLCYTYASYDTEFSCLEAHMYLRRDLGYYMLQIFIPSMLVVMLSWISFWIGTEATPERLSLGISCLLTITVQNSAQTDFLPPVTYIKAIDVWMMAGIVYVLAALLEFVCVHVYVLYHRRQTKEQDPKENWKENREVNQSVSQEEDPEVNSDVILEEDREVNLDENQEINLEDNQEVNPDVSIEEDRKVNPDVSPEEDREVHLENNQEVNLEKKNENVNPEENPEVDMENNAEVAIEMDPEENREVTPDENREGTVEVNPEVIVELNPEENQDVAVEVNPEENQVVTVDVNPEEDREENAEETREVNASNPETNDKKRKVDYKLRARRLDRISKIVFPVSYVVFNIVFWSVYSSR